jgi:hypothetical protein
MRRNARTRLPPLQTDEPLRIPEVVMERLSQLAKLANDNGGYQVSTKAELSTTGASTEAAARTMGHVEWRERRRCILGGRGRRRGRRAARAMTGWHDRMRKMNDLPVRAFFGLTTCLLIAGSSLLAHDPHDPIAAVAISPNFAQDQTVLVATNGLTIKLGVIDLLKSTDGGVTWTVVQGLLNNDTVTAVIFSPAYAQDQTIFLAAGGGLSRSTNQGVTWTTLTTTAIAQIGRVAQQRTRDNRECLSTVAEQHANQDREV